MNRKKLLIPGIILLLVMLLLPLSAGALAESYEAHTMRLLRYDGDVEILNSDGVPRFVMEDVRFDSGESMRTGADSSASVGLDDSKIVTLDALTNVQFFQESGHIRLFLKEGAVFVDVSEKLDENESFDIETTTMTAGIRGTLIFAWEEPEQTGVNRKTTIGVMEGGGQIDFTDSEGTHRVVHAAAGEKIVVENGVGGQLVRPVVSKLQPADIPPVVLETVRSNPALIDRVTEGSENGASLLDPNAGGEDNSGQPATLFPASGTWVWADKVTLVAKSVSKLYDGQPLSCTDGVLVYGLPANFSIRVSSVGSLTDAGKKSNDIGKFAIFNDVGEDVTIHFTNIVKVSGTLRVDPAPLIVWTGSAEKIYDGEPLVCEAAEIRTVPGHVVEDPAWRNTSIVTRSSLGSETMVGVSGTMWVHGTNPITGETKQITLRTGEQLSVSLHTENGKDSISFDVVPLEVKDLPDEVLRLYADNPDLMLQACEDAGWDPEELADRIKELDDSSADTVPWNGLSVSSGVRDGMMNDSTNILINIDSSVTNYNAQALTSQEAHFAPVALDPSVVVTATGIQQDVGESSNTCEVDWAGINEDNYTITYDLGTLTVQPLELDVSISPGTTVYDGHAFVPRPYITYLNGEHEGEKVYGVRMRAESQNDTVSDIPLNNTRIPFSFTLFTGDTLTLEIYGSAKEPGTYTLQGVITNAPENLANISFSFSGTKLTVKPAELHITTGSAAKVYDSDPLTCADVSVSGLVGGDTVTVTATGEQTEIGSSANTYAIDWGDTNPAFYTVVENLGVLEVTPPEEPEPEPEPEKKSVTVTITGKTGSAVYNGEQQSLSGYTVSSSDPLYTASDFTFSGTAVAEGTDPGTYPMGLAASQFTNTNDAFDVTFAVTDGALEITPLSVSVTVTGDTDSVIYNGEKQTLAAYTVSASSPLYLEEYVSFSGEGAAGTDPGTYPMGLAASQFSNTNDAFDVSFSVAADGALEITPLAVTATIAGKTASVAYNGEEQTLSGYTVSASDPLYLEEYVAFSGTAEASGTIPGTYPMGLAASQFSNTNSAFDVTFVLPEGSDGVLTVTVNSTPVTFTAATLSKAYDGTALEDTDVVVSGLPDTGALWAYGISEGSQTDAGSSENTVTTYMIGDRDENNVTAYFSNITVVDGTLTVTPRPVTVTVTGKTSTVEYDGEAHAPDVGYTVSISDSLYSESDFSFVPPTVSNCIDAGQYPLGLSANKFTNNNSNFDPTFAVTDGWLEISAKSITVSTASDTIDFNGEPLPRYTDEPVIVGLLSGDVEEVKAVRKDNQIWEVGECDNAYTIDWGSVNKDNYSIVNDLGKLKITPRRVIFYVSGPYEETISYDGSTHYADLDAYADGEVGEFTCTFNESSHSWTVKTDLDPNAVWTVQTTGAILPGEHSVSATYSGGSKNFTESVESGDPLVIVSHNPVVITADSSTGNMYLNRPVTAEGVSATGLPSGYSVTGTTEGSQTVPGSSANVVKTYQILNSSGSDVTAYFDNVETADGTLEVGNNNSLITIRFSGSMVYDGTNDDVQTEIEGNAYPDNILLSTRRLANVGANIPYECKFYTMDGTTNVTDWLTNVVVESTVTIDKLQINYNTSTHVLTYLNGSHAGEQVTVPESSSSTPANPEYRVKMFTEDVFIYMEGSGYYFISPSDLSDCYTVTITD